MLVTVLSVNLATLHACG